MDLISQLPGALTECQLDAWLLDDQDAAANGIFSPSCSGFTFPSWSRRWEPHFSDGGEQILNVSLYLAQMHIDILQIKQPKYIYPMER